MAGEDERSAAYRVNPRLVTLLAELERVLGPAEAHYRTERTHTDRCPVFVVGAPRSGTTLLCSLLSMTGAYVVPTNLMSRFYYAPCIGYRIEQLLTDPDYDFMGQMFDGSRRFRDDLTSDLGKTRGLLGVHEFFHFWRRFIGDRPIGWIDPTSLASVDFGGLERSLAALEAVSGRAFAGKAMMVQSNMADVDRALETKPLWVEVRREQLDVMASIEKARERHLADTKEWWSVRPRGYERLNGQPTEVQIAGQVLLTGDDLRRGREGVERSIEVDLEALWRDPVAAIGAILRHSEAEPSPGWEQLLPRKALRTPMSLRASDRERWTEACAAFRKLWSGTESDA